MRALKELEASVDIDTSWAEHVQRQATGWPFQREAMKAARRQRLWELRTRFTIEAAAYIAVTESLQAEHLEEVALCTADPVLVSGSSQAIASRFAAVRDTRRIAVSRL
jgi:hypothetical protein